MMPMTGLDVLFYSPEDGSPYAAVITQVNDPANSQSSVGLAIFPPLSTSTNFQARSNVPYGPGQMGCWGLAADYIAAQNLSGHRAITLNEQRQLIYADNATETAQRVLGLTLGAVQAGNFTAIAKTGEVVTEPSWQWTANQIVFLGQAGQLTQTVPVNGYWVPLGTALNATSLLLTIKQPILRLAV